MNNIVMDAPAHMANNSLVIQADRAIKKEDLKFLYLYFQTASYSGGGEMHSFEHDEDTTRLYIKYLHNDVKQAVLKRKRLSYALYNFQALDPQDANFISEKNKRYLIVKNIKKASDPTGIHLYLDYLAEQSTVTSARFSRIFDSTLYVKFKDDINFARLRQKLVKIPDFDGQRIEIFEAYNTNKIILELNQEKTQNALKWHLLQNFTTANGCCCDVSNLNAFPFFVVKFENSFLAMKFLESKTFDTDFVMNFEASWNDDLTTEFISECIVRNNSQSLAANSRDEFNNRVANQRDNTRTPVNIISDYNTRFKSNRVRCCSSKSVDAIDSGRSSSELGLSKQTDVNNNGLPVSASVVRVHSTSSRNPFISKCVNQTMRNNSTKSLTANASNAANRLLSQFSGYHTPNNFISDHTTRLNSNKRPLNNTFDTARNLDDDVIDHSDHLTLSVSVLNSSLPNNSANETQKQKPKISYLHTPKHYLIGAKAGPSNKGNTPSQPLNQSSASSSNEVVAVQSTSSARCMMFKRKQNNQRRDSDDCVIIDDDDDEETSAQVHTTSMSVSKSSFDKDGLEIIENFSSDDDDDDFKRRRKSFIYRYNGDWDRRSFDYFFFCKVCPYRCTNRTKFMKHCRGHREKSRYKCKFCNYYGFSKKVIEPHQRMHKHLALVKDIKMEK